jgi:hypothetical protein
MYVNKAVFGMSNQRSGDLKPGRKERFQRVPTEMQKGNDEFEFGVHSVRDSTKGTRAKEYGPCKNARGHFHS